MLTQVKIGAIWVLLIFYSFVYYSFVYSSLHSSHFIQFFLIDKIVKRIKKFFRLKALSIPRYLKEAFSFFFILLTNQNN